MVLSVILYQLSYKGIKECFSTPMSLIKVTYDNTPTLLQQYPDQESNLEQKLRRLLLYPFNYRGINTIILTNHSVFSFLITKFEFYDKISFCMFSMIKVYVLGSNQRMTSTMNLLKCPVGCQVSYSFLLTNALNQLS